jgi:penicillin G amidase
MAFPPVVTTPGARRPSRRRMLGRVLVWGLLALLLLLTVAWFGGRAYLARSVADYSGEKRVPGLAHTVEITFDEKGIPQIWAQTDEDAYFALGWLHASERLFQMELLRGISSGTLSELFGERAFRTDVRQRTIGFHTLGERVLAGADARSLAVFDAYTRGVNAWIEQARVLPPEFIILRTRPRPWTPQDVATAFVYQSWYPTELADRRVANRLLLERLGEDVLDLLSVPRPWVLPSVPEGTLASFLDPGHFPLRMMVATNNWALAAERSATGHVLHAADPHLAINSVPGLWYLVGMHSEEGLGVLGVTVPGIPLVAMGHNGHAAWSFSVAPLILKDYYTETFHPRDSLQVRTPAGYAPLDVRYEEIRVRGEDESRRVPVYHTPRGVLMDRHGTVGTSMRWSGHDLMDASAVTAALDFPHIEDFESFSAVVGGLPTFSANWIYTHREGTIAYLLGPAIPQRAYNPVAPLDAADEDVRWDGYHPPEMRPSVRNPERGWVATTNNPPAAPDWPVEIYGNFNLLRIQRVTAWMDAAPHHDRAAMERMQLDYVSGRAAQMRDLAAAGAEAIGEEELARRFRMWGGSLAPDDALATVYAFWTQQMTRHLFEDELGDQWQAAGALRDIVLLENRTRFIDDRRTPEVETAADISARAMRDAVAMAAGRPFGEVQTLTITHPLAQAPLVARWLNLNRGPFPRGGDSESLNLTGAAYLPDARAFAAQVAPSMRFVMDWADPDAFTIALPMGQSGNPFSPHYDDFLPLFEGNLPWVVPFSRQAVEARAVNRLRLVGR